jgi:hypothetical protein
MTEEKKQGGQVDDWFQTYSGVEFSLPQFRADNIEIEDICHALSHQCRFNGHTRHFYSVAQHSILVSAEVPREDELWGLLHDASEAYMGDMVGPLKRVMPEYRELERRLMDEVCKEFGLPPGMPQSVKMADWRMLATEKRDLIPSPEPRPWDSLEGIDPYSKVIVPWPPPVAKQQFMLAYNRIMSQMP